MSEFDRVGTCPNPPTITVEGYSAAEGRAHGSLDVTVRVCRDCHEDVRRQMFDCGMTPYSLPPKADMGGECGDRWNIRPNKFSDEGNDERMPILEPMPYRLTVNGVIRARGTLREIEAAVATIATTRLALAPAHLADEVQALRGAFGEGDVQQALDDTGGWAFTLDPDCDNPLVMTIGLEEE